MNKLKERKELLEAYFLLYEIKELFTWFEQQKGEILNWEEDLEEIGFEDLNIQVEAFLKKYKKDITFDI